MYLFNGCRVQTPDMGTISIYMQWILLTMHQVLNSKCINIQHLST